MEFKKEIEVTLERLKNLGFSRDKIEEELEYSENYIDQTLARGGNKRFLKALTDLEKRLLQKAIQTDVNEGPKKGDDYHALIRTLENMSEDKIRSTAVADKLAEDKIRSTAIIEKLVALLERSFNSGVQLTIGEGQALTGKTGVAGPETVDLALDKKYRKSNLG